MLKAIKIGSVIVSLMLLTSTIVFADEAIKTAGNGQTETGGVRRWI